MLSYISLKILKLKFSVLSSFITEILILFLDSEFSLFITRANLLKKELINFILLIVSFLLFINIFKSSSRFFNCSSGIGFGSFVKSLYNVIKFSIPFFVSLVISTFPPKNVFLSLS